MDSEGNSNGRKGPIKINEDLALDDDLMDGNNPLSDEDDVHGDSQ